MEKEGQLESLKLKFDKLADTKTPTGDTPCPPLVRRAKHIGRSMLGKCNACSAGDESSLEQSERNVHRDPECISQQIVDVNLTNGRNSNKRKSLGTDSRADKRRVGCEVW